MILLTYKTHKSPRWFQTELETIEYVAVMNSGMLDNQVLSHVRLWYHDVPGFTEYLVYDFDRAKSGQVPFVKEQEAD